MNRSFILTLFALLLIASIAFSTDYVDPAGTCGQTTYAAMDVFGDVIHTIPSVNPGASNAWVGMAWANGELIQLKNIATGTATHIFRINPQTGATIQELNAPFTGYSMGCAYDGANLWIVQWSPTNVIHQVSLTGSEISSFVPATGTYSCRNIAWDGTNLWVGANYSSNQTNLYQMTTTGTILATYSTNTAVGWHMGSAWDSNVPGGALFVVDNVGNSIKRLAISGTTVTVAAQIPALAASPDVAEGLAFDGEYLWTCGAYASAGLVWQFDDGFPSTPPNVQLALVPLIQPIVIPASGGSFSFYLFATNQDSGMVNAQVWTKMILPNGSSVPCLGPRPVTIPMGTKGWFRTQSVTSTSPSGNYLYVAYLGSDPSNIWAGDTIPFSKSATGDGPLVGDWACTGDPLPGEVMAAPAVCAMAGAYPNPFNPTTTISFTLPQAGYVTLTVFDVNGRQVASLVNGYRASGAQQVTFDGSKLASGMYIYRLQAGQNLFTGKMLLLK